MNEIERLRAENEQLKRDQEFIFLVIDIGLASIEEWARRNGLLASAGEDPNKNLPNGNNEIRVFVEQLRKSEQDALLDRAIGLIDRLKDR